MTASAPLREVSVGGLVVRHQPDGARVLLIGDRYRNRGFSKGHIEAGERVDAAAVREVAEETGLVTLRLVDRIQTIDWYFRFRGRVSHKKCHFFLMRTADRLTTPQTAEGITACRWATFDEADELISYENAREVLQRARAMVDAAEVTARSLEPEPSRDFRPGPAGLPHERREADGTGDDPAAREAGGPAA